LIPGPFFFEYFILELFIGAIIHSANYVYAKTLYSIFSFYLIYIIVSSFWQLIPVGLITRLHYQLHFKWIIMKKELSKPIINKVFSVLCMMLIVFSGGLYAQAPVKNIVLVHGAFADGSGWEPVYKILKKKGYNVSVVGNPNTGLADDVAATKRVISRQNGPVILVGHSYGGAIITEAGNDPKVAGLVYVAAFVPDANETLLQLLQAGPPAPNSGILPPDESGFIWYDVKKYHSGFCADLPKDQADFLADSQIPVSASVFGSTTGNPAWKSRPSWYIVATEDQTIPPDGERYMAKRAGAKVSEIKASHLVFISQPKAVADIIESAAKGVK
jgi:pimeloyl-ACP methyl ester carboxylesterase